jgi:hypothetical protein
VRVRLSFSLSPARPPSLLKPSVALKARGGGKPRRGSKTLAAPNCKFHPKNDGLHGLLIVRRRKMAARAAPFSVLWEAARSLVQSFVFLSDFYMQSVFSGVQIKGLFHVGTNCARSLSRRILLLFSRRGASERGRETFRCTYTMSHYHCYTL